MKQIRSFLVITAFCVFGAGSLFLNYLLFPIAELYLNDDDFKELSSKIIHQTWGRFVWFLQIIGLIKLNIKNPEKLKNIKGGKIITATHPSFIDIVILMSLIPKSTCFVKSKLAQNKVFKRIVNSIFITNDTDLNEIKNETKDFLDKGYNVIIFPMGSRHRKNEYPKIKKGTATIALNAQKNIVPIKMYSSEDFLFINQPFWQGGKQTVIFDIELMNDIEINKFNLESEIISKRELTKEINRILYNHSQND